MTAFLSHELFHFVGHANPNDHEENFSLLRRILESGCISHSPHTNDWGAVSYTVDLTKSLHFEQLVVPTVTCYCDIPLDSLAIHIVKYGAFGLSLSRHHLTKFGARPVIYVPVRADDWENSRGGGTALLSSLEASFRGLVAQLAPPMEDSSMRSLVPTDVPATPDDAVHHLKRTLGLEILAFIKPYDAALDENDACYYYAEREWRKFGNMRFEPIDVVHIVVHPDFIERAKVEFPQYAEKLYTAPPP
ncbi:MAG: abortive infection system antitoxin AbiGi family protein [Sulfuritalea sp.]|nr:abortive infection system antitoxin AbiGi family protein [Sulfuritalea sp.]